MAKHRHLVQGLILLGLIWLLSSVSDRIWFALDRSVPAWDQADYLRLALDYWHAFQTPEWFSGNWWTQVWQLSPKVPPLTFIFSVPFQTLFGPGPEQTTMVYLLFSAILLGAVFGLGTRLFNPGVGLWAAGLCVLLPGLYRHRLQFLLDYPLVAMVTLSFYGLTMWRLAKQGGKTQTFAVGEWLWAIAFGLFFGLALFVKQTALFFLFIPIVWALAETIKQRDWRRFAQLLTGVLVSVFVITPWVKTNWFLMLTSGKRATIDSAIAEGDPSLMSWKAWTYYWDLLPSHISWPLLLMPLVGVLLYSLKKGKFNILAFQGKSWNSMIWLAVFWIGGYLICSLNPNKDFRYSLPLIPVFAVFLAYGLTLWPRPWGQWVRWGTISLAVILMIFNMWPLGSLPVRWVMTQLSPNSQYHAYLGNPWPHQAVIQEMVKTEPELESTLGVLPSTPEINQHNFNYYGALENFQVHARQVGTQLDQVVQDGRSLSWFITKTGQQGSVERIQDAQQAMVQLLETSLEFELQKRWLLPDNSTLNLYHRRVPFVEVKPVNQSFKKVKLGNGIVPIKSPAGVPIPVTLEWFGSGEELKSGLVLLTWKLQTKPNQKSFRWIQDHGIGMGMLYSGLSTEKNAKSGYQVIERMGMFAPANTPAGRYQLEGIYLNRKTGETYPLEVPAVSLEIDPKAVASATSELDLVTQLRNLALYLPQGIEGLELIFEQIGRIDQYDPIQDYTHQAEESLNYRLQQEPNNLELAYGLALATVLQQDGNGAISALEKVIALDRNNPYPYAYLGFVYLYGLNPSAAEVSLQSALKLNPNQPEFIALKGVAALMQGHLIEAWQDLKAANLF